MPAGVPQAAYLGYEESFQGHPFLSLSSVSVSVSVRGLGRGDEWEAFQRMRRVTRAGAEAGGPGGRGAVRGEKTGLAGPPSILRAAKQRWHVEVTMGQGRRRRTQPQ